MPFVAVGPFDELDDAIDLANDTEYGLTAGFFSRTAPRSTSGSTRSRRASFT